MSKIFRPEDVLPDDEDFKLIKGVKVRKGTIRAAIENAKVLSSSSASQQEKVDAKKIIEELAPALVVLDVYDQLVWKNSEIQSIIENAAKKLNIVN